MAKPTQPAAQTLATETMNSLINFKIPAQTHTDNDAAIIEDLLDDERETLTTQLRYEDECEEASEARHPTTVHALELAGLVDGADTDDGGAGIVLTPRGRRIAQRLTA